MEDERVVSADRGRQLSEHLGEFNYLTSLTYYCWCFQLLLSSDVTFRKKTLLNVYVTLTALWIQTFIFKKTESKTFLEFTVCDQFSYTVVVAEIIIVLFFIASDQ